MDWDDLRVFLAVARTGGLTEASRLLRVSQSTVARRVAALEAALGVTLFTRHARGYEPTDAARQMMERLDRVEAEVDALRVEVSGRDDALSGVVRLATAVTLANELVVPALPRLRAAQPGITLEIATGIANISLSKREADLALRLARPQSGRLVVRRVGTMAHGLYAARSYLDARCPTRSEAELAAADFILWDEDSAGLPMARWLEDRFGRPRPAVVANDLTTQVAALRAGLGIAIMPCFCVPPDAGIERLMGPDGLLERPLYLVIHEEVRDVPRVRAVARFLTEAVHHAAPRLAGADA